MFDLGVRRLCANEGTKITPERMGQLFEQYVGLEMIRNARLENSCKIKFWRDPDGPEVDFVIDKAHTYIPVEVKLTKTPKQQHIKHIKTFLNEYKETSQGYLVCQTPNRLQIDKNITAIPWQEITTLFS